MRASSLKATDLIILSIVGLTDNVPSGTKIPAGSYTFDGNGNLVDVNGAVLEANAFAVPQIGGATGTGPTLDGDKLLSLMRLGKAEEAAALQKEFYKALEDARNSGVANTAASVSDALISATVGFVKRKFNIDETDGQKFIIKRDRITVRVPNRTAEEGVTWVIQAAPVWGRNSR